MPIDLEHAYKYRAIIFINSAWYGKKKFCCLTWRNLRNQAATFRSVWSL